MGGKLSDQKILSNLKSTRIWPNSKLLISNNEEEITKSGEGGGRREEESFNFDSWGQKQSKENVEFGKEVDEIILEL